MYEIKAEDVYKDFSNDKEMFDFSNYSTKSKYCDNSKKLVVGKMKDGTAGVAIEEFVGLKSKMYLYVVDDSMLLGQQVIMKDVLLNQKCLRHSMNRIKVKVIE